MNESINTWISEVKRIYAYYGRVLRNRPSSLLRCWGLVDIYDVKRRIAEIFGSDGGLRDVMGNDLIFLGWPLGEHIKPPFTTITDVYWRGEISSLSNLSSRSEICHATIQIDV